MRYVIALCAAAVVSSAVLAQEAKPGGGQAAPAQPAPAQPGARGQGRGAAALGLAVQVTDQSGNGLEGVQVSASGPVDRAAPTTADGRVQFRSMRNGTYRLRFEHDGFITLERELLIRGQGAEVSVALNAAPSKPAPPSAPAPAPPPPAPAKPAMNVEPRSLSIPDYLDKNLIGGEPVKRSTLACAEGGTATLVQVREPLTDQQHADTDELIYVVAGAGVVRIRNQDTKIAPGHFTLVPRGVAHGLRREGRNPLIVLSVLAGKSCSE